MSGNYGYLGEFVHQITGHKTGSKSRGHSHLLGCEGRVISVHQDEIENMKNTPYGHKVLILFLNKNDGNAQLRKEKKKI